MAKGLFPLSNGTSITLSMVHMIKPRPGKGLLLISAFNKPIEVIAEPDDDVALAYKDAIEAEMRAGRDWQPVDWVALRNKVIASRKEKTPDTKKP